MLAFQNKERKEWKEEQHQQKKKLNSKKNVINNEGKLVGGDKWHLKMLYHIKLIRASYISHIIIRV